MYLTFLPAYMRGKKKTKQNKNKNKQTQKEKKTNSQTALSPDWSVIAITQTLHINFMNQRTHSPDMRFNCFGGKLSETTSFGFKNSKLTRGYQGIKCRQGIALFTMLKMVRHFSCVDWSRAAYTLMAQFVFLCLCP